MRERVARCAHCLLVCEGFVVSRFTPATLCAGRGLPSFSVALSGALVFVFLIKNIFA